MNKGIIFLKFQNSRWGEAAPRGQQCKIQVFPIGALQDDRDHAQASWPYKKFSDFSAPGIDEDQDLQNFQSLGLRHKARDIF